ncbi:MAG: RNA-binding domain-containing protein, partial [Infirmifilum sp.]
MKKTRLATSVEISSFIHATEEEERVLQAVKNLLPPDLRNLEYVDVKKSISYGYYGNPIVFLSLNFPESQVDEITLYILSHLPKGDIKSILDDFEKRFARGRLYLRFDKQEAYYGNLKLSEG